VKLMAHLARGTKQEPTHDNTPRRSAR